MRNKQWQPVNLPIWRGREGVDSLAVVRDYDADHVLLKEERMMDGSTKLILRNKTNGPGNSPYYLNRLTTSVDYRNITI